MSMDDRFTQVTADGTKSVEAAATLLAAARPGRVRLLVRNTHATQALYLGPTSSVSATVYFWKLAAGESVDLGGYQGALYGFGGGAATTCVFFEGYTGR